MLVKRKACGKSLAHLPVSSLLDLGLVRRATDIQPPQDSSHTRQMQPEVPSQAQWFAKVGGDMQILESHTVVGFSWFQWGPLQLQIPKFCQSL